ncbi:glycosyltransferase family 2 protein [Arenimonas composti]|uniref:glycosyltransferase family 2 protein n=1 Tax=Arenimonas composti TaxID=370776 RepID=UPI00047A35C9|nr:glycosyltransferase family 2 protein [Arenimonas composti]
MGANDIGVVVVSHESAGTIGECLQRLLAARDVFRIVVIDNASSDATVAIVRELCARDERLSLVVNADNVGFAAACNQGATAFAQPWIAFVNPDCYVERDTLSRLVRHARERPGAGLLGVEMVDEAGVVDPNSRRSDPSLADLLLRFGRRDDLYLGRDPALALQLVDAVSGALMLLPTGLFLRLGGFDEGYRLHVEDLDLCRRVRDGGYEVLVANDLRVVHVNGVSSRRRPLRVSWHKHRGMWRYFRKFEAPRGRSWTAPAVWVALWLHFLLGAPGLLWRARRERAQRGAAP